MFEGLFKSITNSAFIKLSLTSFIQASETVWHQITAPILIH